MNQEHNKEPKALPLLRLDYKEADKTTMVENNFHNVVEKLKQIILRSSTNDKPALVVESLAFDYKGLDKYDQLTVRINIIPGDKVDMFLKDNPGITSELEKDMETRSIYSTD